MARWSGAAQESGPYPQGSLSAIGAVCHRTYGSKAGDLAVARGARRGIGFHFYVTKAGEAFQFYDTKTKCSHAKGANSTCVGIEVESRNNDDPMTSAQMAKLGQLVHWIHETVGVPLKHITPPRTSNQRGFIDHAAVAGSDHGDLWHPQEWDRIVGGSAPPPLEEETDNMQMIPKYAPDGAVHFFYVADSGTLWHAWWGRKEPYGRNAEQLAKDLGDTFDGQPSVTVDKETDNAIHLICDRKGSNPPCHAFYKPGVGWGYD